MLRSRGFCVVLSLVVLLAVQAALAQVGPPGLGLKAGVSYSKVTNDNVSDFQHKLGAMAGISLCAELAPGISLQPELLYVQQGGRIDIVVVDGVVQGRRGETTWRLNYLQLPVLVRVDLPLAGPLVPVLSAGPVFSLKTASTFETTDSGRLVASGAFDELEETDLGLMVGLGFKLGDGPAHVVLDARYNHGLANLNATGTDVAIHNRGFQFLVGFQY